MKWILFIFVFVALFLNGSCKDEINLTDLNPNSDPDTIQQGAVRFLALGDSYTIGHAVNLNQRWPIQLSDSLAEAGIDISGAEIIAQTGWTTRQLIRGIELENPQGTYDIVSLLIGVNNQYRKQDTATYRIEFRELLEMAIAFADDDPSHVIVVSIPDYSVTPFAQEINPEKIAQEIDIFNAINYEETVIAATHYIDITPISRKAKDDPNLIAGDGLHPSGKMYSEWMRLIYPVAYQIIQN
jgi:lysophospholipase L1-like esterase